MRGKENRTPQAFTALIAAGLCAGAIAQQPSGTYDEKWAIATAEELNRSLPRQVDPETRWDRVTPGPGLRLTYAYTLLKQPAAQVDIERFNSGMLTTLQKTACARANMQELMKNGVKLAYTYRGSDGKFVSLLELSAQNCR